MIKMANTDDTQEQTASNTDTEAKNLAVNESKIAAPLMRYFDLTEEATHSYVLGYN